MTVYRRAKFEPLNTSEASGNTPDPIETQKTSERGPTGPRIRNCGRNSTALRANSTVRDSYFLTPLAECIDVPTVLTRIERNQFGINGGPIGSKHRHIHSLYPDSEGLSNANWVVGNLFRSAQGSASVLFESGVQSAFFFF
ncbi:MAG: hypothetical protein ACJ746_24835 [Bryobacteraceae bacterium]